LKTTGALVSPSAAPVALSGQSTSSLGSSVTLAAEQDPDAGLSAPSTSGMTVYTSSTVQGPGVYTKAVTVSGQAHVTLATGTYIFDNGLTVSGQSTITSAGGGVFLYFAGGSLSVNGQSGAVLSPLTSGAYAGVSLFEARADAGAVLISGQGPPTSLAGAVYAPEATIELSGQASFSVGALIANEAVVTGQAALTVG
jgi:hypothetical protein